LVSFLAKNRTKPNLLTPSWKDSKKWLLLLMDVIVCLISKKPSNKDHLVVYPNQSSSSSSSPVKYTNKKKVTEQFNFLINMLTDIKSTLKKMHYNYFLKQLQNSKVKSQWK